MPGTRRPTQDGTAETSLADARAELDVGPDAASGQIRSAFRKRARATHPDVTGERDKFDRCSAVFRILAQHYGHEGVNGDDPATVAEVRRWQQAVNEAEAAEAR